MEAYTPFVWIGIAVFALCIEGVTTQLISVWVSVGAIGGAISCIFTDNILIQVVVFLIITAIMLGLTRPLVKKLRKKGGDVKTNLDRVIGCEATLTKDITRDIAGELKVMGDYWTAVSQNGDDLPQGTRVRILEITGAKLVVEKVTKETVSMNR